jgi:energy-coupling factor transport system substrate-specific component
MSTSRLATLAIIPSAVAFNAAVGTLVHVVKAPIYLDCIGVIATTLIAGLWPGIVVGVLSFAIAAAVGNPQVIFFTGTPIAIAIYTHLLGKHGAFKTMWRTILTGIGMGILAGIISAPVVALLFGGVTSAGSSAVTAFFLATGKSLIKSVVLSGISCEPADKVAQCLIAVWLVRAVPKDLLQRFRDGTIDRNLAGANNNETGSAQG